MKHAMVALLFLTLGFVCWGQNSQTEPQSQTGFVTAGDLYELCLFSMVPSDAQYPPSKAVGCTMFMNGWMEGYAEALGPKAFTGQSGFTVRQMESTFIAYLDRHPETKQAPSGYIVRLALEEAGLLKKRKGD
jgi:Rap1a immunity proteins